MLDIPTMELVWSSQEVLNKGYQKKGQRKEANCISSTFFVLVSFEKTFVVLLFLLSRKLVKSWERAEPQSF